MPKPTPLKTLLSELYGEGGRVRACEITGKSMNTVRKACYQQKPEGWPALAVAVAEYYRPRLNALEAENELLKARLAEMKNG